ncbi:MAG: hypothetical protein JRJ31_16105 [Deltaproteobacteria bacterium]|nr:hypothetical protein [Deltaproteobacteria bacterium]
MKRATKIVAAVLAGSLVFLSAPAWGTEVYVPVMEGRAGSEIVVPIMIDEVENLAGIRLVLHYDASFLRFVEGTRTKHVNSLMHIINDKKPGVLIIVMAGARGIKGKNFSIMDLKFRVKEVLRGNHTTSIVFKEVQLMSDELKEVEAMATSSTLTLLPAGVPKESP